MTLRVVMIKTPESSNIDSIGYLKEDKRLFVRFRSGKTYFYHGVPETYFDDLRDAKSKGEFFNQHVKPNFAAAVITKADGIVFIEDKGKKSVPMPPRPTLEARVDSRWNW